MPFIERPGELDTLKLKRLFSVILLLFAIVPMVCATAICTARYTESSRKMLEQNVETAAHVQAKNLQSFFKQRNTNLQTISILPSVHCVLRDAGAGTAGKQTEQARQEVNAMLASLADGQAFLFSVVLTGLDGKVLAASRPEQIGTEISQTVENGLRLCADTQTYITDIVQPEQQDGAQYFVMAYPIFVDGVYAGRLVSLMNMWYFERLVEDTNFFKTGTILVTDSKGYVAATAGRYKDLNVFALPYENTLSSQLSSLNFAEQPEGLLSYTLQGMEKLAYYSFIEDTGWMVLSVVERSEFSAATNQTMYAILAFMLLIVGVTSAVCLFATHFYFSKPLHGLIGSIHKMQQGDYTLRVAYQKNNEFGEIGEAFNQLMDRVVADNTRLRISEERYRIVTEQSDSAIFEYNFDGTVYHSPNWKKKFGYEPVSQDFLTEMVRQEIVYPGDAPLFQDFFNALKQGQTCAKARLRIRTLTGAYIWCSLRASTIQDAQGRAFKVVGKLSDIDRQVRETEQLRSRAQRDPLTGLYNKTTAQMLIDSVLKSADAHAKHALFVIDIDNFKDVNDSLGHLFGDAVLSEIAAKVLGVFRATDVVGRIGGDEFVVFLRDIADDSVLQQKAGELTALFRRSFTGHNMDYKISGSIGVAVYPQDGAHYLELFQKADIALYCAKNRGKDCYQFYDAGIEDTRKPLRAGHAEREQKEQRPFRDNVSEYIFQILYESRDISTAVHMILDIVGRYFNVSRAYVFESTEDRLHCNNTFEWCNEGVTSEKHSLQHLSYRDDLEDYTSNFGEDGIFYCENIQTLHPKLQDILRPQGIHSLLQCAILNDGRFEGFVGFDECSGSRVWTKGEIEVLTFVSKILSTFLVKMRTQDRLEKSYEMTRAMLDTQDAWIYVVDPETYALQFINQKTRALAPDAKPGNLCYKVFWRKDAPCDPCPMRMLSQECDTYTLEMYNDHFHVWTSATASRMTWTNGNAGCLMCCYDVTRYKQAPGGA